MFVSSHNSRRSPRQCQTVGHLPSGGAPSGGKVLHACSAEQVKVPGLPRIGKHSHLSGSPQTGSVWLNVNRNIWPDLAKPQRAVQITHKQGRVCFVSLHLLYALT